MYGKGIPLWLNEGFAQYSSKGAQASFRRARGYNAKSVSNKVERRKLFPLTALTTMAYPADEELVTAFYDESERLVRFLIASNKEKFPEFLSFPPVANPLEAALFHTSAGTFATVAELEQKFFEYAADDPEESPPNH